MSSTTVSRPPVDDLPAEVLLKIFHAVIEELDTPTTARCGRIEQNMERPLQLGQVSRRWRALAISDPSLWTSVHINFWSLVYVEFFKRSSPLPIDLSINVISSDISMQRAQKIAGQLKKELDASLKYYHPYPAANRIRTVRLITGGPPGAISFTSMLEKFRFPSLTSLFIRPGGTERDNRSYPRFNPPVRESLTSLALYQLSRGLKAERLRNIFASCPCLETLILGVLELDGRPRQAQGSDATVTAIHAPALKTLVVASPIFDTFRDQNQPCSPGCPCVFRDLIASNLEYLEIAGEVTDALHHLTPLINWRAHDSQPGDQRATLPTLKVMINAGGCSFPQPDQLLTGFSSNIHFHLFADTVCDRTISAQVDAWIQTTCSTTFYLAVDVDYPSDPDPDHPLASFPHLPLKVTSFPHRQATRGMIPVLVHPATGHPFLNGGIEPGPYHDPETLDQAEDAWDDGHYSYYSD